MGVVDSDNIPRALFKFPVRLEPAARIHLIAVMSPLGIEVPAFAKGVDDTLVSTGGSNQEAAALVGLRRLHMIVDLTQYGRRNPDQQPLRYSESSWQQILQSPQIHRPARKWPTGAVL